MSSIRSKHTGPELLVRKLVYALGYRYRLHAKRLPGCPDLVFRPRKKVIFVHGCFWHCHADCSIAHLPKSRAGFWKLKLEGNRERDERNRIELIRTGWKVLTLWECQLKNVPGLLEQRLKTFLDEDVNPISI